MQEHLFMLYTPTNAMPEGVGGGGGGGYGYTGCGGDFYAAFHPLEFSLAFKLCVFAPLNIKFLCKFV